ncbi:GNAT family N-acetyltransferase [Paraburkholderia jirisanensis]
MHDKYRRVDTRLALSLRAATLADEPFLLELRGLTMTEHLARAGEPIDAATHYERMRFHFDDAQIICYADADVGLLKLSKPATDWYLYQIQILPSHQRKGLGTQIIRAALAQARAAGATITLHVLRGNPARRLYENLGFEVVSESDIDFVMKSSGQ